MTREAARQEAMAFVAVNGPRMAHAIRIITGQSDDRRPLGVVEAEAKRSGPDSPGTVHGHPFSHDMENAGRQSVGTVAPAAPSDTSIPPRPQDIGASDYAEELWAAIAEDPPRCAACGQALPHHSEDR